MNVEELERLVGDWNEKLWEERDEDEEVTDFWNHFYYGSTVEREDGSYEWENKDPLTLGNGAVASYVDDEEFLDDFGDKVLRVIVKVDPPNSVGHGIHFACEGWDNSWSGDGAFDGPVYEVMPERKIVKTWKKVKR